MKSINLKLMLFVLFVLLAAGCGSFSSPPTDKTMEENFRANETEFNKLVKMLEENSQIENVNLQAAYGSGDNYKLQLPPERMNEYRRLLNKTGIRDVSRTSRDQIFFPVWSKGSLPFIESVKFSNKYYIYTETSPSPLSDSLDDLSQLPNSDGRINAFKKISDNWYLAYIEY